MERELFDRETVLDLTVNFIPLVILLVFIIIYLVFTPFGFGGVISSIQFAIMGAMFIALAALTYYSGAAVSRAEKESEAAAALEDEQPEELEGEDDTADLTDEEPGELAEGANKVGESGTKTDGNGAESDTEAGDEDGTRGE